jgi:hypothetical protein
VYLNGHGDLMRIIGPHPDNSANVEVCFAQAEGYGTLLCEYRLRDGACLPYEPGGCLNDLLPGEFHLKDDQWVPVEEDKPAKSLGALIRQAQMKLAESTFNGKPAVLGNFSKTPTLDKLENTKEPKRAPLDWNKSVPFNNFPGFDVTCRGAYKHEEDVMLASRREVQRSPDLCDSSHQANPAFGSAALLKD